MEQLLRCPPCRNILPPHQKYCHRAKKAHSFPFVLSSSPPPQQQLIRCYAAASATEASSAKVIDGKLVAKQIRDEIAAEVSRMREAVGVIPGLAVILVGDRKDSATYVRNKKKACESVGINSLEVNLPSDSTEEQVLNFISDYNDDPSVHGILVQLPLPSVCF